jgi:hypothetical protein
MWGEGEHIFKPNAYFYKNSIKIYSSSYETWESHGSYAEEYYIAERDAVQSGSAWGHITNDNFMFQPSVCIDYRFISLLMQNWLGKNI